MLSFAGRHFLATATELLGRRLFAATGALTEEGAAARARAASLRAALTRSKVKPWPHAPTRPT
jgi:hypothetical protein